MLRAVIVVLISNLATVAAMTEPLGPPVAFPGRSFSPASVAEPYIPISSSGRRTIVGAWRHDDGVCTLADGAIEIAPLGLRTHDVVCSFDSVSRAGGAVTWTGTCRGVEVACPLKNGPP